jgi:pimeloyl-ACP methyl ester carboxylesterase
MKTIGQGMQRLRYTRNLLLVFAVGLLVAFYVIVPFMQAYQAIHPSRKPVCCVSPAHSGLDYEDVTLETSDGLILQGWYIPSSNGAAIIVIHGFGSNRIGALPHGTMLAQHGYGVLLIDLRTHGESEGEVFPFAWESDKDVLAALEYLKSRPDVDDDKIGALGLSTGGIVVLQAATNSERIRAVVSDGAGAPTAKDSVLANHWFLAPGIWTSFKSGELLSGVSSAPALVDTISQISPRPVMLISATHGPAGEAAANRNYYAAAEEPKIFWELSDVGHVGGLFAKPEEYEARVVDFFDQALQEGE